MEFSEMICSACVTRLPFLWFYNKTYGQKLRIEMNDSNADIDVSSTEPNADPNVSTKSESLVAKEAVDSGIENSCDSVADSSGAGKPNECKLKALKSGADGAHPPTGQLSATYWPMEWRRQLCKCNACLSVYADNKCQFLTDDKDMVHYYEKEGMTSNTRVSDYDKGLSEL
ncbi:unnamed protein product, partial [Oppiella nova]